MLENWYISSTHPLYKMYISFIEIGQVVPENQVLKVLKVSKIYKIYTTYRLIAINCETYVPENKCNMCKLSYTPMHSSLIIFCELPCYLNGNSPMHDQK